jgi:hypothetical protein
MLVLGEGAVLEAAPERVDEVESGVAPVEAQVLDVLG